MILILVNCNFHFIKKRQAQRQARKYPDESYYYYQNDVQGEDATYKQAQEWEPTSTIQRNAEQHTNAEKLKSLIADGYEKLIGQKFGQPTVEERQDINDVLPAIDSFYTQATEFITANSVSIHFFINPYKPHIRIFLLYSICTTL